MFAADAATAIALLRITLAIAVITLAGAMPTEHDIESGGGDETRFSAAAAHQSLCPAFESSSSLPPQLPSDDFDTGAHFFVPAMVNAEADAERVSGERVGPAGSSFTLIDRLHSIGSYTSGSVVVSTGGADEPFAPPPVTAATARINGMRQTPSSSALIVPLRGGGSSGETRRPSTSIALLEGLLPKPASAAAGAAAASTLDFGRHFAAMANAPAPTATPTIQPAAQQLQPFAGFGSLFDFLLSEPLLGGPSLIAAKEPTAKPTTPHSDDVLPFDTLPVATSVSRTVVAGATSEWALRRRRQRRAASTEPASRTDTAIVQSDAPTVTTTLDATSPATAPSVDPSLANPKRHTYQFTGRVGRGNYGEVWTAVRNAPPPAYESSNARPKRSKAQQQTPQLYVLKRLFIEKGERVRLSGLREIHFGIKLHGQPHVARFVEFFEERGELWLVFMYEGFSLHNFLYSVDVDPRSQLSTVRSSDGWRAMKHERASGFTSEQPGATSDDPSPDSMNLNAEALITTQLAAGKPPLRAATAPPPPSSSAATNETTANATAADDTPPVDRSGGESSGGTEGDTLRSLIRQILSGVAISHFFNTTHRDLKPSNILIDPSDAGTGLGYVRLCDFGSGFDNSDAMQRLYPPPSARASGGPTKLEATLEYAPPEVVFGTDAFALSNPQSYDLWSVGVLFLELILGTSDVFRIDQRTRAVLEQRFANADRETVEKAALFRAFVEMCIYVPPVIPAEPESESRAHSGSNVDSATAAAPLTVSATAADTANPTPPNAANESNPPPPPPPPPRTCDASVFARALQKWDPYQIGAPDIWAVRLLYRLLFWDPDKRITAKQALSHAYLNTATSVDPVSGQTLVKSVPYTCGVCGSEFELPEERDAHSVHAHGHV